MKTKDVPDLPILQFLYQRELDSKIWCTWFHGYENSIDQAMPLGTPEKIVKSKMQSLIQRGLVDGCYCGCRGDYEITQDGIEYINTALGGEADTMYERNTRPEGERPSTKNYDKRL